MYEWPQELLGTRALAEPIATVMYRAVPEASALGSPPMSDTSLDTPRRLREEAERCRRIAKTLTAQRDIERLEEYARELLEEADRLETAWR